MQVRLDAREHLLFLERLGDVVDATDAEGLDLVVGALEPADEDDGDIPQSLVLLEPSAHVYAGHLGHTNVEEDEIGRIEDRRLDGEPAARDRAGNEATAFQDGAQQSQVLGGIVHDEDIASLPSDPRSYSFHGPRRLRNPS